MKIGIKLIKRFIRTFAILFKTNWLQFLSLHQANAKHVIWIRSFHFSYWGSDLCLKDFGIINGLCKENIPFKVVYANKIGKVHNKVVFITLDEAYNTLGFEDYTSSVLFVIDHLEQQKNFVCPNKYEASFWENKAFMHSEFIKAKVSEPNTLMFNSYEALLGSSPDFPFLIKAEHSCSSKGLFKIDNKEQLDALLLESNFMNENKIIIKQQLINMRKDLRVIIVNNEIVLHYWRINLASEWKPTSTSFGSDVDFVSFPNHWREHILETFNSLNLTTGAFDITWQNDDLSTLPLYLEVSPVFQPNPIIKLNGKSYSYYKNNITKELWDVEYVDIVFSIKHKEVKAYLQKALQVNS